MTRIRFVASCLTLYALFVAFTSDSRYCVCMQENEEDAVESKTGSVGRRIALYRKALGFSSAQDLARAIPNEKLTASVIQNIESGRKADMAVSQLLDISLALGISPIYLLTAVGRPEEKVDLPGVGGAVAKMTNHEFDEWVSVLEGDVSGESGHRSNLRYILRSIRALYEELEEWQRLSTSPERGSKPIEIADFDEEGNPTTLLYDPATALEARLYLLQQTIDTRVESLTRISKTVDLSWVSRPWRSKF